MRSLPPGRLKFGDEKEFRRAARHAAASQIAVDVPGNDTLIVHLRNVRDFQGFMFTQSLVAQKVSDAERATLRRRVS
jgi:hypothetical protein